MHDEKSKYYIINGRKIWRIKVKKIKVENLQRERDPIQCGLKRKKKLKIFLKITISNIVARSIIFVLEPS